MSDRRLGIELAYVYVVTREVRNPGPARARGRVASTLRAASAGESMVYRESGYIVKVTVETNSARMSEV